VDHSRDGRPDDDAYHNPDAVNPPMALRYAAIFSDTGKTPNQTFDNPETGIQDRNLEAQFRQDDRMTG
jgi:hypothetical protein